MIWSLSVTNFRICTFRDKILTVCSTQLTVGTFGGAMSTTARRLTVVLALPVIGVALQFWPDQATNEESTQERTADLRLEEGEQALASKDFHKATSSFTEALELYSELRSDALHLVDMELDRAGRREFSSFRLGMYFNNEVRLKFKIADVYCKRGLAYNRKGEFSLALTDFNDAAKISNNRAIFEGRAEANR